MRAPRASGLVQRFRRCPPADAVALVNEARASLGAER